MSNNMDMFGDLSSGGRVLSRNELVEKRKRAGQCPTCGQRLFNKTLFKSKPITIPGKVLNGRCLACNPQDPNKEELVAVVAAAPASRKNSAPPRRDGRGRAAAATRGGPTAKGALAGMSMRVPASMRTSMAPPSSRAPPVSRRAFAQSMAVGQGSFPLPSGGSDDDDDLRDSMHGSMPGGLDLQSFKTDRRSEPHREMARPKRTSHKEDFLDKPTPRPSTLLLNSESIADLLKDYNSDDDSDEDAPPTNSAVARLTPEERQALQTLNSADNSFLDIVTIMLMNSTSAPVNDEGLHALSLLRDPDVKLLEEVADSCGFEVIVSAMGKCSKDSMAQTNACKVLFISSAAGEDLQRSVGRAGGIEALVDAMEEFSSDVIVLEGCLLALGNLCVPEENLQYALDGHLIELIVNAMSDHVENCGLQEHGCAVLANLAVHEEARRRVRECGGCDTVVVSMVVNPMDVDVQCQALVTLRNLCVQDEENKVVLANAGAIDVVIQAMQNHRDNVTAQGRGSWVLGIIGMNEDNKIYIGENGGPDVIVRSMLVHEEDLVVQEMGCRALWTLSVDERNRINIVEVGAIPAIVAAMKNHAAKPSIQERGCGVLANLAANDDDLKIAIVMDGALDATVMAMVLHGENEQIQDRAVALLFKLCIPENIEHMVNANVSPMMAVVAENFPECQEKASYVLMQLQR